MSGLNLFSWFAATASTASQASFKKSPSLSSHRYRGCLDEPLAPLTARSERALNRYLRLDGAMREQAPVAVRDRDCAGDLRRRICVCGFSLFFPYPLCSRSSLAIHISRPMASVSRHPQE